MAAGLEKITRVAGGSFEVFDASGASLGFAVSIKAPDISIVGGVAVFPYVPLVRNQTQIDAMAPPISFVLYANSTTGQLQYFDGTNWIVLGSGGGVIGVTPAANVSWESDHGVTGSPAASWASIDGTVTLVQASGTNKPAVTGAAFGATTGLTFDGVNDFIAIASKVISTTGAATISLVFKTPATIAGPAVIISQSNIAVANDWFELGIDVNGRIYVENNNAGTKHTVVGVTPLAPSTAYNAILCYDGTDFFMMLGGVEENPLTIANIGAFAWFGRVGGTTVFTVGGTQTSGGLQRPFAGVIGGIYFWSEDLTA